MSSTQTAVLVVVLVILVAAVVAALSLWRRARLRQRFGPEYDRVVTEQHGRTAAERELRDRERRHSTLTITELSPQSRAAYARRWEELQARFVDAPQQAVNAADDLVTEVIAERGYPTGDYDEQVAQLSVEHANTLDAYREAHEITEMNRRGTASTEELRRAVVHYRVLVADLLGGDPLPASDLERVADREPPADPDRVAGRTPTADRKPTTDRKPLASAERRRRSGEETNP